MTVKEAIAILQTKNPDAEIVVYDKEGGYDHEVEIKQILARKIPWNGNEPNRYFYGNSFNNDTEIVVIANY